MPVQPEEVSDSISMLKSMLDKLGAKVAGISYDQYVETNPFGHAAEMDSGRYTITLKDAAYRKGAISTLDAILETDYPTIPIMVRADETAGNERVLTIDLKNDGKMMAPYYTNGEFCRHLDLRSAAVDRQIDEFRISPEVQI